MIIEPDLTRLKPYGDTMDDGRIQLSFTLPVPDDDRAIEAAKAILLSMGLSQPLIASHQALDPNFTHFGRKIRVIGASTGTDAHTVGIDAIMNMKGYAGHYGLERYAMLETLNLGSQVDNEDFIQQAVAFEADVLLVSQTVTQKDVHVQNLTQLVELLEAESLRDRFLLIAGGPRINHELAKELGYDAGFGPGKYADEVAAFMVTELWKRQEAK